MSAMLMLYMVRQLLLSGRAEQVVGLTAVRGLFEFRGSGLDPAYG
jgi:hypothetical protein